MFKKIDELLQDNDYQEIQFEIGKCNDEKKNNDIIKEYSLKVGSSDDTCKAMNEVIEIFKIIIDKIHQQLSIFGYIRKFRFIHKNERMECYWKLKGIYINVLKSFENIKQIMLGIREQNKNIITKKDLNMRKYDVNVILIKQECNHIIEKSLQQIKEKIKEINFENMNKVVQTFNNNNKSEYESICSFSNFPNTKNFTEIKQTKSFISSPISILRKMCDENRLIVVVLITFLIISFILI